ncbi:nucleoside transporter-domain-containing protein [Cladochytrium replicatum]|nr:nucleoside transporter-domain-containing protein [Cladochytrium replicatum]
MFWLRYTLFFVAGISTLSAWNTWITASSFFRARFSGSPFVDSFLNYFSLLNMSLNILCLGTFVRFQHLIRLPTRIVSGGILLAAVFSGAAIMSLLSESIAPSTYFYVTLLLLSLGAVASALLTGFFALASTYPPAFTQALAAGQGIAGAVPSVAQLWILLSDRAGSNTGTPPDPADDRRQAFTYFAVTVGTTLATLAGFYILQLVDPPAYSPLVVLGLEDDQSEEPTVDTQETTVPPRLFDYPSPNIWTRLRPYTFAVFLNFVVTLSLFPSITSSVLPLSTSADPAIFTATHFLVFNIFDLLGKTLPSFYQIRSSRTLAALSIARVGFVPLLLLCNVGVEIGRGKWIPTVFGDVGYWIILVIFATSSGYVATVALMQGPKAVLDRVSGKKEDGDEREALRVDAGNGNGYREVSSDDVGPETATRRNARDGHGGEARLAGDIMVFALSWGLAAGALFSFVLRAVSCGCNPVW